MLVVDYLTLRKGVDHCLFPATSYHWNRVCNCVHTTSDDITNRSSEAVLNLFLTYYTPILIVSIIGAYAIVCAVHCSDKIVC